MKNVKQVKCIVPISGGKDSQACLHLAVEEFGFDNVLGLFCDTQFEHPKTYQHIKDMSKWYGIDVHTISGGSVGEKVIKHKRFPGGGARHCTDELKIRETRIFLKEYSEAYGGVQVWYGMRTDESAERSKRYAYRDPDDLYHPHEILAKYPKYLGKNGVRYRLPIVDWNEGEVFELIGDKANPLYESYIDDDGVEQSGFKRVGCFPCLASGDAWKIKAFGYDDFGRSQLIRVRQLEVETGKSVFTSGIGKRYDDDSQGCRICEI
ncbi:phosphoadenosine phosphosulfate reductase family protein [Vibrio phage 1.210.O._10N.222.52.C2]|nr:phosphoadenosine phosphosulfate reductase family protein [Vibrio phage 1.210.O._10N.222.52.C2]